LLQKRSADTSYDDAGKDVLTPIIRPNRKFELTPIIRLDRKFELTPIIGRGRIHAKRGAAGHFAALSCGDDAFSGR
jgi:hypothetical protein